MIDDYNSASWQKLPNGNWRLSTDIGYMIEVFKFKTTLVTSRVILIYHLYTNDYDIRQTYYDIFKRSMLDESFASYEEGINQVNKFIKLANKLKAFI